MGYCSIRIGILIGLLVGISGFLLDARAQSTVVAESFVRPDVAAIRAQIRSILSDPDFAPRKSAWQWLTEKLSHIDAPDWNLPPWLGEGLIWLLLIWCLLTLLAIIAHLIWTLIVFLRNKGGHFGANWRNSIPVAQGRLTFEEICRQMEELAAVGRYRESLALMILALVCLLDRRGILRLRESKTNGEYLREYPFERGDRAEFCQFVLAAEDYVYGGSTCPPHIYRELFSRFDRLRQNVQQDA